MSTVRLTTASYVVLGLIEHCQPATVYDLKRVSAQSVVNFWALPHTQLYSEAARLAKAGLLSEEREETGRRRRLYSLTDEGLAALDEWRAEPTDALCEIQDPATLKLFFGARPAKLAALQVEVHQNKLREYERTRDEAEASGEEWSRGMVLALELGMLQERYLIEFWSGLAAEE